MFKNIIRGGTKTKNIIRGGTKTKNIIIHSGKENIIVSKMMTTESISSFVKGKNR
jgi:hypothetical protein